MKVIMNILAMLKETFGFFLFMAWPMLIVLAVSASILYLTNADGYWYSLAAILAALTFAFTMLYHVKYAPDNKE